MNKIKMVGALKIWVVIYPSLLCMQLVTANWMPVMPLYAKTLLMTAILVPWVVFAGVPFVNYLIRLIKTNEKI